MIYGHLESHNSNGTKVCLNDHIIMKDFERPLPENIVDDLKMINVAREGHRKK